MMICREQAICSLFCEPYTEKNVMRLSEKLDSMEEFDICYLEEPTEPVLVFKTKIYACPFKYTLYTSESEKSSEEEEPAKLNSVVQVVQFINEVFVPYNPHNKAVYQRERNLATTDIFRTVSQYTDYFDDKTLRSFVTWCGQKNLHFLKAGRSRKKQLLKGVVNNRTRMIYVMKEKFVANVVSEIVEYSTNYKLSLKRLEEEGFEMIGYVRKSRGKEKDEVRIRLLETMAERLKERGEIKTVYASPFSDSMDVISERDLSEKSKSLLSQLSHMAGSTQDMMKHLSATKTPTCLIVIDFAGLSRNCEDIQHFVRCYPKLKKILIDRIPVNNTVKMFTRDDILNNDKVVNFFQCRQAPIQRSKK